MTSPPKKRGRWGPCSPRLFYEFSPIRTYLSNESPAFRDKRRKVLLDVDFAQDLLLLGYAAMLGIGAGRMPDLRTWHQICTETKRVMWSSSEVFEHKDYWARSLTRLELLDWSSSRSGSLHIEFLHDALLREREGGIELGNVSALWCMLSLLWIDDCVRELSESGEASEAVQAALRASDAWVSAQSNYSLREVRSMWGRSAVRKKLANDPVQRQKEQIKVIWTQERHKFKTKTALANHIHRQFPDRENQNVLLGWFRDWERETSDALKGRR